MKTNQRRNTWLSSARVEELLDELSELIYVVDLVSYDILFINRPGKLLLGIQDTSHLKCYKAIHGKEEICDFCPNHLLTEHEFYNWEHYNCVTQRYYLLKDKIVNWEGRRVKIQVAFDITDKEEEKQRLVNYLGAENLVTECARILCNMQTDGLEHTIQQVLEKIGSFWGAECVYLFQTEEPKEGMAYEWKSADLSWKERIHAYMPLFLKHWKHYFIDNSFVKIENRKEIEGSRPGACQMLEELKINSVFVLPLRIGNHLMGFIGMDNYNTQKVSNIFGTLNSISYFTAYALRVASLTNKLKKMSYTDLLTDTWNHNGFLRDQEAFNLNHTDPVGVVFIDINEMKQINDQYGHTQGDRVLVDLPKKVRDIFREASLYRVGGDEFIAVCEGMAECEFRKKVQRLKVLCRSQPDYTFSVGEDWTARCGNIQSMIIAADQRMYQDKKRIQKERHRGKSVLKQQNNQETGV